MSVFVFFWGLATFSDIFRHFPPMSPRSYILDPRQHFPRHDIYNIALYKQIIGSLVYLMNTRPDICFVVNTLSQYLVEPRRIHLVVAKHVMRYLKGKLDYSLHYTRDHEFRLYGYTDLDWAGRDLDRKSTLGCCFSLGSAMTSWQSRKQSSISLSTTEA